jgi:hypothetical protein
MSIEVLDAVNLNDLPQLQSSNPSHRYLRSLVKRGPLAYVENANVRMKVLVFDEKILPLVISDRVAGNSNICSPYAHYLEYAFEELARRHKRVPSRLLKAPRSLVAALLGNGSIDRVVFVNNWLLTTNPRHGLSSTQIATLSAYLIRLYPDSAIVFRSINPLANRPGLEALRTNNYRLVASRRVYMLATGSPGYLERSNVQEDFRKLKQTPYSIVEGSEELAPQVARITELYRDLYLGKYSMLNPHYTSEFFSLTLKEGFLTYRAFVQDGRVDAFIAYYVDDGLTMASVLAYDQNRPQQLALYRTAFALMIHEAAKTKALLNLSAGSGEYKILRGAQLVQEYDAVLDRHLPANRRVPWAAVRLMTRLGRLLA